ncbi:MAG: hypothetical protein HOP19_13130 [Acidobacteria bacterium]|nr:hypothetical protein [Acidobacteriota bacterium]
MKKLFFLSLLFSCLWPLAAPAQSTNGITNGIRHLTIYDAGVAEFLEERTLELQPGVNTIEWRSLMPKTFIGTIRVTAEGADVTRQNITYDGNEVRNEKSPVLHLTIDNKGAAGVRRIQVDYLAPGLRWQADYSLLLEATGKDVPPKSGMLDGWVTIFNETGTDVSAGAVDLIAGEIALLSENDGGSGYRPLYPAQSNVGAVSEMVTIEAASATAEVGGLSVFARIRLGKNISMKANALVNRLPLVQRAKLTLTQRNVFEHAHNEQTVARGGFTLQPRGLLTRFVTRNETGITMPAGKVTLYSRDNDLAQIAGQDRIPITANNAEYTVSPGRSSNLVGTRRVISRKSVQCRSEENCYGGSKLITTVEIVLANRSAVEADAFVREGVEVGDGSEWKITQSTVAGERLGEHSLQFKLTVPAGGRTTLTYTVETK